MNEHSPVFQDLAYSGRVIEGQGIDRSQTVVQLAATDVDADDRPLYRFASGTLTRITDRFAVDQDTGAITVRPGTVFDREGDAPERKTIAIGKIIAIE